MEIALTQNQKVLVDVEDYENLSKYTWIAHKRKGRYYAARWRGIQMHRTILNAQKGQVVDHINGDTLDNRKVNLRLCAQQENSMNRCAGKNNTSGYKGVTRQKGYWRARIVFRGIRVSLGLFETVEDAARAYNKAAQALHGEFARLNTL